MKDLRNKSVLLTGYLALLLTQDPQLNHQIQIITPMDPSLRGCQLSISIKNVSIQELESKLLLAGVVIDVREPEVIRAAPVPLYNTFHDIWIFVSELHRILIS
jgi:kynureninase